jgi:hypothetical protein
VSQNWVILDCPLILDLVYQFHGFRPKLFVPLIDKTQNIDRKVTFGGSKMSLPNYNLLGCLVFFVGNQQHLALNPIIREHSMKFVWHSNKATMDCPFPKIVPKNSFNHWLFPNNHIYFSADFVEDCLSEQHRRPRFAGPVDAPSSALFRLSVLQDIFRHSRGNNYFTKMNSLKLVFQPVFEWSKMFQIALVPNIDAMFQCQCSHFDDLI